MYETVHYRWFARKRDACEAGLFLQLDPVACAGLAIGAPRASLAALNDLHRLLIAYGFERSSADDATVVQEEPDEAVSAQPACPPTAPGARFRQASGDEP